MSTSCRRDEGATPAASCAQHDYGGGVRCGDAFAIYSVVASPLDWCHRELDTGILAALQRALLAVELRLPILTTLEDGPELVSLPCPSRQRLDLPWFLLNAATSSTHCVLGEHSPLQTLLVILQRPWCVLELCCCDTSTVAAVYNFTTIAVELDSVIYRPACSLLSYEMIRRAKGPCASFSKLSQQLQWGPRGAWPSAFGIYADLSRSRLRSHNSFWMGLICICAISLGIRFSDLTLMLLEDPRFRVTTAIIMPGKMMETTRTHLLVPGSQHPSQENTLVLKRRLSHDSTILCDHRNPSGRPLGKTKAHMVLLYSQFLRIAGEMIG